MNHSTDFEAAEVVTLRASPNWAARCDGERKTSTPDGSDCTCYFQRDWSEFSDDAVRGGRWIGEWYSSLMGVIVWREDGSGVSYSRDAAYDAFGVDWVHAVEASDAEAAR